MGDYEAKKIFVESLGKWLQKNANQILIASRLLLYYNIAIFHFLYEEYSAAHTALNAILQTRPSNDRVEIRNFAPVLNLVSLHELRQRDPDYYDSLFESRFRRLDRNEKNGRLEQIILKFMRRTQHLLKREEIKAIRTETKEALESLIREAPDDRPPTGTMELTIWLEARIEGEKVGEVFEQKLKERDQPNRTTK